MVKSISYFLFDLQCLTILISFFFSLRMLIGSTPRIIRLFILYNTVAVLVMIPFFLMTHSYTFFYFGNSLNNYSLVFGYTFLSYMLIMLMPDKKSHVILKMNYFLSITLILILLYLMDSNKINYLAFATSHISLLLSSIIYLHKLYNNIPDKNLKSYPPFWIVIGILFCSVISFPLYLFVDYLRFYNIQFQDFIVLSNLPVFSYIVMHVFFIKAFLCSLPQHKML